MIGELIGFAVLSFTSIFVIVDPVTLIPIFLSLTQGDSEAKRRAVVKKACLVSLVILLLFAFTGSLIFRTLGVTLPAFQIAGGILLLFTGLDQLKVESEQKRTSPGELEEGSHKGDVAIVPLAIPLLAGPGAIATVMMLNARASSAWAVIPIVFGIVATSVSTYLILRAASPVDRVLGKTGRAVLERVMGLLLVAIAVQFIVTGIGESFPGLVGFVEGAGEGSP